MNRKLYGRCVELNQLMMNVNAADVGSLTGVGLRPFTKFIHRYAHDRVICSVSERVGLADFEAVVQPVLHADLRERWCHIRNQRETNFIMHCVDKISRE